MRVYLSHDRSAEHAADLLRERLTQAGCEAVSESGIPPGSDWQKALDDQLGSAEALVFIIDRESQHSPWLEREWSAAAEHSWEAPDKPMIPVLLDQAEPPPFLRDRGAIRVAAPSDWDAAVASLLLALQSGGPPEPSGDATAPETARLEQQARISEIADSAAKLQPSPAERETLISHIEEQLARSNALTMKRTDLAKLRVKLADALRASGRHQEAVTQLQAAVTLLQSEPQEKRQLARVEANLARSLGTIDRDQEGLAHWQRALALYDELDGANSLMVPMIHMSLASVYEKLGDAAQAARHRADAQQIAQHWLQRLGSRLQNVPVLGTLFSFLSGGRTAGETKPPATDDRTRPGADGGV